MYENDWFTQLSVVRASGLGSVMMSVAMIAGAVISADEIKCVVISGAITKGAMSCMWFVAVSAQRSPSAEFSVSRPLFPEHVLFMDSSASEVASSVEKDSEKSVRRSGEETPAGCVGVLEIPLR